MSDDNNSQEKELVYLDTEEIEDPIWIKKYPDETDKEASLYLLELRKKYKDDFRTMLVFTPIWEKIAQDILEEGYNLGDTNIVRKVRRKFENMKNGYLRWIKLGQRSPPLFYYHALAEVLDLETDTFDFLESASCSTTNTSIPDSAAVPVINEPKTDPTNVVIKKEETDDSDKDDLFSKGDTVDFDESASFWDDDANAHKINSNVFHVLEVLHKNTMEIVTTHFDRIHSNMERQNELLSEQNRMNAKLLHYLIKEKQTKLENSSAPLEKKKKYTNYIEK